MLKLSQFDKKLLSGGGMLKLSQFDKAA